ncbi:MAG: hypothetical protein KAI40_10630 [Desulfobacterales bacterium]|nr:hypothetical protein [Desulfobacterales bacterium]
MTYSLDIHFQEKNNAPICSKIFVKFSTRDDKLSTYITPNCLSISEIEEQIDRLHKELDNLLQKAKRKYKK